MKGSILLTIDKLLERGDELVLLVDAADDLEVYLNTILTPVHKLRNAPQSKTTQAQDDLEKHQAYHRLISNHPRTITIKYS